MYEHKVARICFTQERYDSYLYNFFRPLIIPCSKYSVCLKWLECKYRFSQYRTVRFYLNLFKKNSIFFYNKYITKFSENSGQLKLMQFLRIYKEKRFLYLIYTIINTTINCYRDLENQTDILWIIQITSVGFSFSKFPDQHVYPIVVYIRHYIAWKIELTNII